MENKRQSGLILHPTSLPGKFGIGDLGREAYEFVDFLVRSKASLWQILPLGIPSYGNSPYQCISAFAGNPLLVSPEFLVIDHFIEEQDIKVLPKFNNTKVDFDKVAKWKNKIFKKAFENYKNTDLMSRVRDFEGFCEEQSYWLDDFSVYASIKQAYPDRLWSDWPKELAMRKPDAISKWKTDNADSILFQKFLQFMFHYQWHNLKSYANRNNVQVVGDIPIFVAYDSSDVWANPDQFLLDEEGKLISVAGVPPDYFSETGQRWGNPLYRWNKMREDDFHWWRLRIKHIFEQVDWVRIDHFRGFEAYWEIPAEEETAINGEWVKGPGTDFFSTIEKYLGELPIIAEDLGVITPEVEALRDQFKFPGMKILHFAFFEGDDNPYLPHHYNQNCVVYTGTHDNNTTIGWYREIEKPVKERLKHYLGHSVRRGNVAKYLVRLAWSTTANMALCPVQDILNLDEKSRMNMPGTVGENWNWRFSKSDLNEEHSEWLAELNTIYQRS